MPLPNSKPVWPETSILLGAGMTAPLNMPASAGMGESIRKLAESDKPLQERIKASNRFRGIEKELECFLTALGDDLKEEKLQPNEDAMKAAKKILPDNWEKEKIMEKILKWKSIYNWNALRRLAIKTPLENEDHAKYLTDLYNLIDGSLLSNQGVQTSENTFLEPHKLRTARNLLVIFSNLMLACGYHKTKKEEPKKFKAYLELAKTLGELMQKEAIDLEGSNYSMRDFYFMSFSVISFNFEPFFLWSMFMANDGLNKNPPHIGKCNLPVKLFHDFSTFAAVRDQNNKNEANYPLNETVARRTNQGEDGGRLYRICKFYLAHGCANFRECENCGKMHLLLGNWEPLPKNLFYPPPFKTDLFPNEPYTEDERKAQEEECEYDAVQCPFCGRMTYAHNAPMIMQSSYKGGHASFLEEIQRDAKVSLSGAKHIILMGYQLPPDDIVWRSAIVAKRNEEKIYCSVVVGHKGEDRWLEGGELKKYAKEKKKKIEKEKLPEYGVPAIDAAIAIFGKDNVRAYAGGIPQVWCSGGSVDKNKVKDLLYPKKKFPNNIAEERINRA